MAAAKPAVSSSAASVGGAGAGAGGEEPNPNPFPSVCAVEPVKFSVEVKLGREISKQITLQNTCTQPIAFKVKTTSRDRYGVRPTQGYIGVGQTRVCEVIVAAMKEYPPADIRDKFLVQSVAVQSGAENEDISKFWRDKEKEHVPKQNAYAFHEQKIKCKLHVPAKVRAEIASQKGAADAGIGAAPSAAPSKPDAEGASALPDGGRARGAAVSGSTAGSVSSAPVAPAPAAVARAGPGAAVTAQGVVVQAPAGVGVTIATPEPARAEAASEAPGGGSKRYGQSGAAPVDPAEAAAMRKLQADEFSPAPQSAAPASAQPRVSSSAPASAAAGGGGGGGDGERKTAEDYRELLNLHVKLTLEHERVKREHGTLFDAYNKLLKTNDALQKQCVAQQQQIASADGAADADSLRRRNAAAAAAAEKDGKKPDTPATAGVVAAPAPSEGASGVPMWVLGVVALLFFVLGRIFSDF